MCDYMAIIFVYSGFYILICFFVKFSLGLYMDCEMLNTPMYMSTTIGDLVIID